MYLLDSHALIWFLENDDRLSRKSKSLIESNSEVYVSIVSLWEINIKLNIGKISLSVTLQTIVQKLALLSISILPLTFEHINGLSKLPFHHKDPFDRILISQSIIEDLIIISKDDNFKLYPTQVVW
ncbi:MAG: type II toxin-antitoxin system VapC family toxin [Opitutaceae bacterium]|nr:type II toxin-antitoxin system VapC family toxin [Cytophagales bacterium]